MNEDASTPGGDAPQPHHRRPRYSGTHPRRFEERYKELQPDAYPDTIEHLRAKGKTPAGTHVPILVAEVMDALAPAAGDVVADGTLGYGGHALEFMQRIGPDGRLVGFDVDAAALARARPRLESAGVPFSLYRSNFAGIGNVLATEGIAAHHIIFADLGVSSMQIDDPARGFSYKHDGPLDMRMDDRATRSAADLVQSLAESDLAAALTDLADEPDAALVARAIVQERRRAPIATTGQLVQLVFRAKGLTRRGWREQTARDPAALHPAALVFQALRMLVNDEPARLKHLLRSAPACLAPGGRLGIISFHSGEDRLVKHALREGLRTGIYAAASDDPIRPTPEEIRSNPRAASAKFRWARKAPAGPNAADAGSI
jgi:16S rRNA (cytosine1402-N4)-methyltransferase